MSKLLPDPLRISISRSSKIPASDKLGRINHLVVALPPSPGKATWDALPHGKTLAALAARLKGGNGGLLGTHLPNKPRTGVTLGYVKDASRAHACQAEARKLAARALAEDPESVGIIVAGLDEARTARLQDALVAALLAAAFPMPAEKKTPPPGSRLARLKVYAPAPGLDLDRVEAVAEGNNLARWLTALPPNRLDAAAYRKAVMALAKREGWKARFLDERVLAKEGAGAFLAVAQGNAARDAGIVHLQYRPEGGGDPPAVALVGKGICFDTGGTNLKPFKSMLDMHEDMQGSAVALGSLLALTRCGYQRPVDCWLALTENRIAPNAYKSRDIVTAANGVTIEVIHTDAEGRMVLADTLVLACRAKPRLLVDYATLTGACVSALTTRYSGVFSNRPQLYPALVEAGADCGERVWPFPMDADFDEDIESKAADIAQCATDNDGDHILAARFLGRFVADAVDWVHLDLSAGHRKGGLGVVPTPVTGFGVRYTVALLTGDNGLPRDGEPS